MTRGGRSRRGRRRRPFGARPHADRIGLSIMLLAGAMLFAAIHLDLFRRAWTYLSSPRSAHSTRLTMDQARAVNAAIPFVRGRRLAAGPFRFHGTPAAREQAAQCLATAALYEAGDDARGQRAVMQVVLNRVREPGFPKTVCGVVYQGADRATGCQFSFACDGSAWRRPEHAGWDDARRAARRALAGDVFRPVGTATHYHTDWIVPYWIGSLDKIAEIHSHIFYARHGASAVPPAPSPTSGERLSAIAASRRIEHNAAMRAFLFAEDRTDRAQNLPHAQPGKAGRVDYIERFWNPMRGQSTLGVSQPHGLRESRPNFVSMRPAAAL